MNSITRTPVRVRHETRLRLVQVARVESISPRMRRITFAGEALKGFTSAAADDHVKLFFPEKGQDQPVMPIHGPDGLVFPNDVPRPISRDYTPRHFDSNACELVIEFVLHSDGPGSLLIPDDYDTYLLVGDETALPAIGRRLEEMPPTARVFAVIEAADRYEKRYLPTAANAQIMWLYRDGALAGMPLLLERALKSIVLPTGDIHAWIAGEIEVARRLRQYLIEDRGISRNQIKAAGYWRKGEPGANARIEE